jgi:hypothetical protein
MASDSTATFGTQTYLHADKIVNLVKGLPIGAMVTGNGGVGAESISTLLKDLRARLDGSSGHRWSIDHSKYTVKEIAERVREFLFVEKGEASEVWMQLRLCGYSAGKPLSEIWEVRSDGKERPEPRLMQGEDAIGVLWDGEYEPLNRLLLGVDHRLEAALREFGIDQLQASAAAAGLHRYVGRSFVVPPMPIQDAIDLARWLVDVTVGYVKFSTDRFPKTVGGSTEIAAITKHEGFKWVQRRHFYPSALNPMP